MSFATATATTMGVTTLLVAAAAAGGEEEMELLRELAQAGEREAREFLAFWDGSQVSSRLAARGEAALERRVAVMRPRAQYEAARASLRAMCAEVEARRAAVAIAEAAKRERERAEALKRLRLADPLYQAAQAARKARQASARAQRAEENRRRPKGPSPAAEKFGPGKKRGSGKK